jgi:large subunit ribosomal protein L4
MKLKVYSADGKSSNEVDFPAIPVFEGDKGVQTLKDVIVSIRANMRQGTRSTKTRGEVSGGGKKPFKQKGTGRARAGSIRSPLWSGGGVVFGPRPRDFSKKINVKAKALALSRALFDRASAGEIEVIESWQSSAGKTKEFSQLVKLLAPKGKLLLVDAPFSVPAQRAAKNICRVSLQEASKLNPLDLAQYKKIILSSKAIDVVLTRVNGGNHS